MPLNEIGLEQFGIKETTCFIPQGMLSIDVPIIVFHIANLWRETKGSNQSSQTHSRKFEEKAD